MSGYDFSDASLSVQSALRAALVQDDAMLGHSGLDAQRKNTEATSMAQRADAVPDLLDEVGPAPQVATSSTTDTTAVEPAPTPAPPLRRERSSVPKAGFKLAGVAAQPLLKGLPEALQSALRAVLDTAASEAGVVLDSKEIGQTSLVMAYLCAQLDVELDLDPRTAALVDLFARADTLGAQLLSRLDTIRQTQAEAAQQVTRLQQRQAQTLELARTIEHGLAYRIADETVNFLRGDHNLHNLQLSQDETLLVRGRMRDAANARHRYETEREGRSR